MPGILNSGGVEIARFVAPTTVKSVRPVYVGETLNLRTKVSMQGNAQRWEITSKLEPLVGDASLMLHTIAFDSFDVFAIKMPQMYRRTAVAQAAIITSGTAATGSAAFTQAGVGSATVGEFIRFSNHNKAYMVTSISGSVVSIFPNLLATVPSGTVVETGDNTRGFFRYSKETIKGMTWTDGILMDVGEITLVEAL